MDGISTGEEKKSRETQADKHYKNMRKDLRSDHVLLQLFCVIGLPSEVAVDLVKSVEREFDGDYDREGVFKFVCDRLAKNDAVRRCSKDLILTMFPDCNDPKMPVKDPRKKFLEKDQINEVARYAFPEGFKPLHQVHRPRNQLLPMAFMPDDEIIYLQYLIFYESLEEQYATAAKLYEHVLEELDEKGGELADIAPAAYDEDQQDLDLSMRMNTTSFSNLSLRSSAKTNQGHSEPASLASQSILSEADSEMAESVKSYSYDSNAASLRSTGVVLKDLKEPVPAA